MDIYTYFSLPFGVWCPLSQSGQLSASVTQCLALLTKLKLTEKILHPQQ